MATLMQNSVSDVLEMISDLRGESTTNTDASRIRAINRSNQDIAVRYRLREFLLQDQELTSTGVNTYTIGSATYPMRKRGLESVFVGDTTEANRHKIIDKIEFRKVYNTNNSAKVAYEYYDRDNDLWKIYINPTPTNGDTIYYSYFYLPPNVTTTTDIIVGTHIDAVARLALAYILEGEEEYDLADSYKRETEQLVTEQIGLDQETNLGNSHTFSSYGGGIGTY